MSKSPKKWFYCDPYDGFKIKRCDIVKRRAKKVTIHITGNITSADVDSEYVKQYELEAVRLSASRLGHKLPSYQQDFDRARYELSELKTQVRKLEKRVARLELKEEIPC